MLYFDALDKYNGKNLFREYPLGDTIYHITYEKDEPYIVISKGQYKTPPDIYADLGTLKREKPNYITQDHGSLIGNLFFLRYYYNQKYYSDIWDIKNNNLIYRGVFSRDGGINGIPLVIEGHQMNVWISYVNGNYIYIEIKLEDAMKFMPNVSENDNPVILELKLKK